MTYLDPERTRQAPTAGQIALRVLVALAVLAFGWFAFTVGNEDGTGRPEIVPEPTVSTF